MGRLATEVTYDADADMAYVHVAGQEAGASVRQVVVHDESLPSIVVVDIDKDGRIRGFELFDGSKSLPLKVLDEFR